MGKWKEKLNSFKRFLGYAWVNVYLVGREYGGAEEGGWWFDVIICQKSIFVPKWFGWAEKVKQEEIIAHEHLEWGSIQYVNGGEEIRVYIQERKAVDDNSNEPFPRYE